MDLLKTWETYETHEQNEVCSLSSAVVRYLKILERLELKNPTQNLYAKRHRAWITCAAATLLNKQNPHVAEAVCAYWSRETFEILQTAWEIAELKHEAITLLALGKLGARELNLSSDIDIMFVSQEAPTLELLKKTRRFIHILSENTEFGFMYRVDTDLKPGGRLAPLISSLKQLEDYYWSSGATWERLALVRLSPACGPTPLIDEIRLIADRFSFRKFVDYALLEDLRHLRTQIHYHATITDPDVINIKLSSGGIRDIELFCHALQVIHGGRNHKLKIRSTTAALTELQNSQRFDASSLEFLKEQYWYFRSLENEVQAAEDHQTHLLRKSHFHGIWNNLNAAKLKIDQIVAAVIGEAADQQQMPTSEEAKNLFLSDLGYTDDESRAQIDNLLALSTFSKTYQYEQMRLKVLRIFLEKISLIAADRRLALALLVDFFKSTRAKAGFFSLLLHEQRLIDELVLLFGLSPYLGHILASRPELLDTYLYRSQPEASADLEVFLENLFEKKLITELIAANQFLKNHDTAALSQATSDCADEICLQILSELKKQYSDSNIFILALGKWGAHELGLKSDLDFIFVTPGPPTADDNKVARKFITHLTAAHRGGTLYMVDLRLRPSGQSGPLIVSFASLCNYLAKEAAAWERQSYLRARFINSGLQLNNLNAIEEIHKSNLLRPLNKNDWQSLAEIRQQLIHHKASHNTHSEDVKFSPGGLFDIELAVQAATLEHQIQTTSGASTIQLIASLEKTPSIWAEAAPILSENYIFLRRTEQMHQLVYQHGGAKLHAETSDNITRLATAFHLTPQELQEKIYDRLSQSLELLKRLDPRLKPE